MTTIKTLENTSIATICATFNLAFSDYIVPMQITEEQLGKKMCIENIKLEYSVGAFENNELIAFILHGHDVLNGKQLLYNGGTGVIPAKRGNKLTLKLYEFIIPQLRQKEISTVTLEVITTNIPAINSYKKAGFTIVRELICYKSILATQNKSTFQVQVLVELEREKLTSFWDWIPTWQNYCSAIENSKKEHVAFGIYEKNNLIGYIIFNSLRNRVLQFAVDKEHRNKGVASQLFNYIFNNYNSEISLINIESTALQTISFLKNNNFQQTIVQYEMVFHL